MNSLVKRIQLSRSAKKLDREQRVLESWERERVKGKTRFVWRMALTYSLTFVGGIHALEHVFGIGTESSISLVKLISYFIFGIVIASCTWSSMEAKYEDALRKAHTQPLPNNKPQPQSGQGVSKAYSSKVVRHF